MLKSDRDREGRASRQGVTLTGSPGILRRPLLLDVVSLWFVLTRRATCFGFSFQQPIQSIIHNSLARQTPIAEKSGQDAPFRSSRACFVSAD